MQSIALQAIAIDLMESQSLALGFYALGDNGQFQVVRESNDGLHQRPACWNVNRFPNEGLIDLQDVERKAVQVRQRRVPVPKSSTAMLTPSDLRLRIWRADSS